MDARVERVLSALGAAIDADKLSAELERLAIVATARTAPPPGAMNVPVPAMPAASTGMGGHAQHPVLAKLVIDDLLDDSIREAKRDDRTFPLRLLLGEVSAALATSDEAFALGAALATFFRSTQTDEAKMYLALEASEHFYRFAAAQKLETALVQKSAPLLAALLSSELERLKLESVDHVVAFDSSTCERGPGADSTQSRVLRPLSFVCRINASQAVRAKAKVLT